MTKTTCKFPVGTLTIEEQNGVVCSLNWGENGEAGITAATQQLQEYFAGKRREFSLPLKFEIGTATTDAVPTGTATVGTATVDTTTAGTDFQKRVWSELTKIPYGETVTYGELARRVNSSPRAVGGAVSKNPLPIIVPCHRVVGQKSLGGYSGGGGLKTKQFLLKLEINNRE